MSLQVNLSSPDIRSAYDAVLGGSADYLILTYEKGSNDLKVQELERGSLDDALFDFSSGRMQYGFVRVTDQNTQLPKFVLINWCGEGVPESRKGLFASHAASVAQYLKHYHVSVNARREDDLDAKGIMKKVTDSSGSKYSAAGQSANTQAGGRIEPVGSSYKPVGAPDIAGLRKGAQKDVIAPVGTAYQPPRDELSNIRAGSGAAPASVPDAPRPAQPLPAPAPAPASTAASSETPLRAPSVGGIVGSVPQAPPAAPKLAAPPSTPAKVSSGASQPPAKPADDDRIRPVGTAYEPVRLSKPGKLGANRFPFGSQAQEPASTPAAPAPRPSGGLTWSQRQEKAKKEREEEDARSKAAAAQAAGVGAGAGVVAAAGAGLGAVAAGDAEPSAPPAPPAPFAPAMQQVTEDLQNTKLDEATAEAVAAPNNSSSGQRAVAVYEYTAAEDNEISFAEGDTITGIEQVDEGWWSGIAPDGQEGLFPATYVELLDDAAAPAEDAVPAPPPPPPAPPAAAPEATGGAAEDAAPPPPPPPPPPPEDGPAAAAIPAAPPAPPAPPAPATDEPSAGPSAVAQYDYEAAEDNELGFSEGDTIAAVEFASDDWWSGTLERTGETGLFPANYVELQG